MLYNLFIAQRQLSGLLVGQFFTGAGCYCEGDFGHRTVLNVISIIQFGTFIGQEVGIYYMEFIAGNFDVAVIGAGHAGIEAALAAARLGMSTICYAINIDSVGNMPCNPAVGGTGKGHLVRELDALGGEMGVAADKACIQYRLLNRGKGPAVHSLRAQADRREYQKVMKRTLETQERLILKQAEIVKIGLEDGKISSVITRTGAVYRCKAVIICTGTFLGGRIIIGDTVQEGGPDGMFAATELTENLRQLGLPLRRFKTGTPPRVSARSIDFTRMELQKGDREPEPFSFRTKTALENRAVCYLTYTNEKTHEVIRRNLDRSPLFSGVISGVGPRYCPSIEDKVVRFADKKRHQLFIEPMGLDTDEMYVQGLSSSLPEDVQIEMLRTIEGLEKAEIMRPAYAIEYDCVDPLALRHTLEVRNISGLYGAGQFCGSSGYEEAAVQGFVAGVNASLKIKGRGPLIIDRGQGYIGALIDDLVTKGTDEPYRMMTSRSEYRIIHRQDNADIRMTSIGRETGLVPEKRYREVLKKYECIHEEIERLGKVHIPPSDRLAEALAQMGTAAPISGISLKALLRRPGVSYKSLMEFDPGRPDLPDDVARQVEISVKYEGYIAKQLKHVEEFKKSEGKRLPEDMDYSNIDGLRIEARQKLTRVRPENLGQASRISGVSAADITALMIFMENRSRGQG